MLENTEPTIEDYINKFWAYHVVVNNVTDGDKKPYVEAFFAEIGNFLVGYGYDEKAAVDDLFMGVTKYVDNLFTDVSKYLNRPPRFEELLPDAFSKVFPAAYTQVGDSVYEYAIATEDHEGELLDNPKDLSLLLSNPLKIPFRNPEEMFDIKSAIAALPVDQIIHEAM